MNALINKAHSPPRTRGNGVFMNMLVGIGLLVLALFLLWMFAIAPQMFQRPSLTTLAKYDYAHRGLHNAERGIPENSLLAFRIAAESGFGIELDVQLTRDQQVVVFHDEDLSRVCGQNLKVCDLTYDELQKFPLLGTSETIPTLRDALAAIGRRTPVIVELKYYSEYQLLCPKVFAVLSEYKGAYCVESFNPLVVKWFKDHQPQVIRGQLMTQVEPNKQVNKFEAFWGRNLFSNFITRPHFEAYQYEYRNRPSMWLAKNMLGMQEISWIITDIDTYRQLKNDNCIIIFEGFEPYKEVRPVIVQPPLPIPYRAVSSDK